MHQDAMALVWRPDYRAPIANEDLRRVGVLSADNALVQGTLFIQGTKAYLAFTGTHTAAAVWATLPGTPQPWGGTGGKAQDGVLRPFEAWVASGEASGVVHQAKEAGAEDFVLLGYSQGGGLAVMMARWLAETEGLKCRVYTLNSLRSFQADFVAEYHRLGLSARNFIYRNDPVSEFPLGSAWFLPGTTQVLDGPRGGLALIDDHFLDHFFVLVDAAYRFHYPVQEPAAAVPSSSDEKK